MGSSVSFVKKALYDCGDGTDVTQAKTFFDQPLQTKLRWRLQDAELNQGYTADGDEANGGVDHKESYEHRLKPFLNFHPKKIQTLTLIERSHKLFPLKSDYVGISLATTLQEHIFVEVEGQQVTGAYLV